MILMRDINSPRRLCFRVRSILLAGLSYLPGGIIGIGHRKKCQFFTENGAVGHCIIPNALARSVNYAFLFRTPERLGGHL